MKINEFIDNFDIQKFRAYVHHIVRYGQINDSDSWERATEVATGGVWIFGDQCVADCFHEKYKIASSIKSTQLSPKKVGRKGGFVDFIKTPSHFKELNNLRIVINRCTLPETINQNSPKDIGEYSLQNYKEREQESLVEYKCEEMIDIIIVHGESADKLNYFCKVLFFTHEIEPIVKWDIKKYGRKSKHSGSIKEVIGYNSNGDIHFGRVSKGYQETCTVRYYDIRKAIKTYAIGFKIPKKVEFNYEAECELLAPPINQFTGEKDMQLINSLSDPSKKVNVITDVNLDLLFKFEK